MSPPSTPPRNRSVSPLSSTPTHNREPYDALLSSLPPQARFRLAVQLDGTYQPAYANLGLALASQARHLEAATAHRQALALEPSDTASGVGLRVRVRMRIRT